MGNNDAIAAVNHWRGQCLDNFARVEKAIIVAYASSCITGLSAPPRLHESAAKRTENLANALKQHFPEAPIAKKAVSRLGHWSLREKQRNGLVHGCFTVKGDEASNWSLINEVTEIKKGVGVTRQLPMSEGEAAAFLRAIIDERKELESALRELKTLKHKKPISA